MDRSSAENVLLNEAFGADGLLTLLHCFGTVPEHDRIARLMSALSVLSRELAAETKIDRWLAAAVHLLAQEFQNHSQNKSGIAPEFHEMTQRMVESADSILTPDRDIIPLRVPETGR